MSSRLLCCLPSVLGSEVFFSSRDGCTAPSTGLSRDRCHSVHIARNVRPPAMPTPTVEAYRCVQQPTENQPKPTDPDYPRMRPRP